MVPMVAAFFMLRFMNPTGSGVLYVSTAMVGASTGAISAIAIPISSEMFGMKSFGVNHNILVTNIAFGSLLFGEVAGIIYDESSSICPSDMNKHPRDPEGRHLCVGRECFEKTFLVWGCVCLFGIVLCIVLCMTTRELYESIHKKQYEEMNQN
jgi:MFS family permease